MSKREFIAQRAYWHDGRLYQAGDKVMLTEGEAKYSLLSGAIATAKAASERSQSRARAAKKPGAGVGGGNAADAVAEGD